MNVSLANLAAWSLQVALLVAVGLALPAVLRLKDPGFRLRLGQLLLATALLLPLIQPRLAVDADAPAATAAAGEVIVTTVFGAVSGASGPGGAAWMLSLLAAGVLARLLWLSIGFFSLGRIRSRAEALPATPPAFETAARRAGASATILVSDSVGSPVTLGWRRPVVLVPRAFAALDLASQEAVACHELLHVRRRDGLTILFEEAARALLWFHPAVWILLSRIGLAREQEVDREVVRLTGNRAAYLRALSTLARQRVTAPVAVLSFHTPSHLIQRVALIAKEVPVSKARLKITGAFVASLLVLTGAAAARAFPLVSPADEKKAAPAPAAEKKAKAPASAPAKSEVLKVGHGVSEPVLLKQVQPVYPEQARKDGLQGEVVLNAVIDEKGIVTSAEVLTVDVKGKEGASVADAPPPSGDSLSAAAVEAVRKWTYKPAKLKGKPVKVEMTVTVAFKLA